MKLFTVFTVFFLVFIACNCSNYKIANLNYPGTINIDTNMYRTLQKKFKIRQLWKAQDYLGGLDPSYPIAVGYVDCVASPDTDWRVGGFICAIPKLIIKKNDNYIMINNREELIKTYAPITSEKEALSYAILYTRYFAILDEDFFKSGFKYHSTKPTISYSKKTEDGYRVHLFSYQQFGCSHPYYSIFVKVNKNGIVETLKKEETFKDPKQEGLCVD
jgi:hypothetical protein